MASLAALARSIIVAIIAEGYTVTYQLLSVLIISIVVYRVYTGSIAFSRSRLASLHGSCKYNKRNDDNGMPYYTVYSTVRVCIYE